MNIDYNNNKSNYDADVSGISNLLLSQNKSIHSEKPTKVSIDPSKIKCKKRLKLSRDNSSKKDLSLGKLH